MVFKQVDPLINNAMAFARHANDSAKTLEERAVLASLSQAWALIAQAQATENSWIVKPVWKTD